MAYDQCLSIHVHCVMLKTKGIDFSRERFFMVDDYLKMMWRRIDFLRTVLEIGYNFVFMVHLLLCQFYSTLFPL
jgi:hypothetical protein